MPSTRSKKAALVEPLPATTKRKRSESVATSIEDAPAAHEPAPKRKKAAKAPAAPPAPQTRRTTRAMSRASSVVSEDEPTLPAPKRRTTRATSRATSQITEEDADEPARPPPFTVTDSLYDTIEEEEDDRPKHEPGEYEWQPYKPETMKDHLFQIGIMNELKRMRQEREAEHNEEDEPSNHELMPLQGQGQYSAMGNHTPHTTAMQPQATPKTGFFSRIAGAFTPFNGLRLWGTPATQAAQQPQAQPQASQATPASLQQPQHIAQPQNMSQDTSAQQQTNQPQQAPERASVPRLTRRSQQPHQAASQASPAPQPTPHTQHLGAISLSSQDQAPTPARHPQHLLQPASEASLAPQPTPHTQHLGAISLGSEEQNNTPMERPTIKRKRSAIEDIGLDTISESPETSGLLVMATPSKPPVDLSNGGFIPRTSPHSTTTPRTVQRARPIAKTRAARDARLAALTPTFQRYAPPTPKDPNADRRILRLREIEGLKARQKQNEENLARLEAEQQADKPRKTKRVKVDHLKTIPHNLPGESEGSFRVPDWDSEDEMEVDEDAELVDNPFDMTEEVSEEPQPTPAVDNPVETASPPTPELITDKSDGEESDLELEWPALPPRQDEVLADIKDAEECFQRGFELFMKTGDVLTEF